jgi:hypothetical protein
VDRQVLCCGAIFRSFNVDQGMDMSKMGAWVLEQQEKNLDNDFLGEENGQQTSISGFCESAKAIQPSVKDEYESPF